MCFKFTAFVFILFFNNFYLDTSVTAAANYEWNSTNPIENVRSFGKIFNDIYKGYCQKSAHLNEEVRILNFYYTYVKYATDLADRFSNEEPSKLIDTFCRKKSKPKKFYDIELENEMSASFNKNFLNPKKAMPRAVGDQLWQLTFSFAARSLLGMLDVQDILKFQYAHGLIMSYNKADSSLQKLLMAYKLSSTHRGEHGIFPFRIIKCSRNQTQLHVAFEEEAEHLEEYSPEQMKYIENFKLVLSFSEHTLTPYEVYKVIRAITMEYELNRFQNDAAAAAIKLPTVYTLFKHFVGNVDNFDNLRRVFINFKRLLYARTNLNYCTIEPFNDGTPRIEINEAEDVRAECQDGFHEHLSYFAHAVRIDKHQCKEIVQVADDLQKILEYGPTLNNFGTCRPSFLFNYLHDILIKLKVLKESQEFGNLKSNIFYRNFGLFKSQFSELLVPVLEEFKCTSSCPMLLYELNRKDSLKNIPKFLKILFDALNKVSDQVELDGKDRSLVFPILLGEQLLDRVYQLIEEGTNSICKIGEILDFVKTVQNIVASTGQFNFAQKSKAISPRVNSQLFKLLFSLAIRLTLVTGREEDLIGNHLRAFINAYKCIQMPPDEYLANNCFLQNQISNKKEQIKIQLCFECKNNDKIHEKNKKNFEFLLSLPDYSPSVYEVLKLAKELGNTINGDIWIRQSDPIFFLKIYHYLNGSDEQSKKDDVLIKNGFCTFSDLIGDLLKQLVEKDYIIPSNYCIEDIIGRFFNTQDNLCRDNSEIENEKGKNLKARDELCEDKFGKENSKTIEQNNILHFGKAISINFNANNDLHQIVPLIMKEVQEMLEKEDWNCTNLHFTKLLEWNLLKIELCKIGRPSEWEQIETLKTQWRDSFNSFFQNKEQIMPDFKAFAVKLTKILETIEQML